MTHGHTHLTDKQVSHLASMARAAFPKQHIAIRQRAIISPVDTSEDGLHGEFMIDMNPHPTITIFFDESRHETTDGGMVTASGQHVDMHDLVLMGTWRKTKLRFQEALHDLGEAYLSGFEGTVTYDEQGNKEYPHGVPPTIEDLLGDIQKRGE